MSKIVYTLKQPLYIKDQLQKQLVFLFSEITVHDLLRVYLKYNFDGKQENTQYKCLKDVLCLACNISQYDLFRLNTYDFFSVINITWNFVSSIDASLNLGILREASVKLGKNFSCSPLEFEHLTIDNFINLLIVTANNNKAEAARLEKLYKKK